MANAHLPNSHPDVTPDWRAPKFKSTPFSEAIVMKPVEGTENCFSCNVPPDWCNQADIGLVGHGGLLTALIISTSRKYFTTKHSTLNQPDPINLHVQFLDPVLSGLITLTIQDLKIGSKHSVVQISIRAFHSSKVCTIAIVTHGNLSSGTGQSIETPLFKVPNLEDCQRWSDAFFYYVQPPSAQYRAYTPKGGPSPMWSPSVGQNARDMWMKLDDESDNLSLAHLGVIVDLVPDIPLNYEKSALKGIMKWAFPTVCLSLDIKGDPSGEEWLLQRTVMNECSNGRYEMDLKLITEKGKLLATSKHVCLMIARALPNSGKNARKGAVL